MISKLSILQMMQYIVGCHYPYSADRQYANALQCLYVYALPVFHAPHTTQGYAPK